MPEPTEDQLDEHVRRLIQIRKSEPTELLDADLEAMVYAHKDGCVRMAMAELLAARARIDELKGLNGALMGRDAAVSAHNMELRAQVSARNTRITELEQGANLMGAALAEYNAIALEVTGTVPDPERGDGTGPGYVDWQGVWEQVAELRPQLDAANKRNAKLENDNATYRAALHDAAELFRACTRDFGGVMPASVRVALELEGGRG